MFKTRTRISDLLKKAVGLPPTSGCCGGPSHDAGNKPQSPSGAAVGCCTAADGDDCHRPERMETVDADKQ